MYNQSWRLRRIWHRCGAEALGWAACSGAEPGIITEGHNQKARAPDARLDGNRLAAPGAAHGFKYTAAAWAGMVYENGVGGPLLIFPETSRRHPSFVVTGLLCFNLFERRRRSSRFYKKVKT